ncbi:DUF4178 domain-containing protein [Aquimarina algicola]|uniref:DUF4178 domain-containing protein n=1 Tax=Aquimarina algicola TaxID=2589995 RepID=A0A504JLF6_9FLAO|nr:DUF4178 domain-containing protein [Aquimarina algicola]TPN89215.1 DUF4178 domain-containing protein [Aquimarina algicola]
MGIFNFFKKDKKESKIDFTVNELKKGYILDYFMKTWEVKSVYLYDWGNNSFAREYFLDAGNEKLYLYVEEDDELICSVWKKIDIIDIDPNIIDITIANDDAPNTITYKNSTFTKISSSLGNCAEEGNEDEYDELISWTYQNKDNKELISVNRVGEEEFEATHGNYVKEYEFSNILPR